MVTGHALVCFIFHDLTPLLIFLWPLEIVKAATSKIEREPHLVILFGNHLAPFLACFCRLTTW